MAKKEKTDKKVNDKKLKNQTTDNSKKEKAEKKESKNKKYASKKKKEPGFEEKYNLLNDKYLRLSAEYDNYRKRTLKERMELMKNAGEDILINFLPVMDNIERAKNSIDDAKEINAIKEGIDLIYKSIYDFLTNKGISEINAKGETFDTDLHEAITKIPTPEEDMKGKVVDVIEKGYKMKDKVLRYAKVVVGE
ncbi:MAG: nucleotide exchange factor GrpE [Bacteroidales bacterium]|nr:nucleotide exchange factor GrpE [Bacteroidales bacterium]